MSTSIFDLYTAGLSNVLQWDTLLLLFLGVVAGTLIGAMPGLSATMGLAVVTPLTYAMSTGAGWGLLLGVYAGAVYGGCITAIVANIPGTPNAIMTTMDGHALAKKGKAGLAIGISTFCSLIGGLFSIVILTIAALPLAKIALAFSAQEYFACALVGISTIAIISDDESSGGSVIRGLISGVIGLLLATVGLDPMIGSARFTFGNYYLLDGLQMVPVLIGFFGLVSCIEMLEKKQEKYEIVENFGRVLPTWKELKSIIPTITRSSIIGVIVGAIPAAGGTIASIVAYGAEKRVSKHPEEFGKGSLEGLAASETANNAVTGGDMIPMLALGVPGDAATAVLLGALTIKGLTAGPTLFTKHIDVVSSIYIMLVISNFLFFFVGLFGAKYISKVVNIPTEYFAPLVLVFCLLGAFAPRGAIFDVWTLLVIGVFGYIFVKVRLPAAPVILGFVLGKLFETGFRRGMMLSRGDFLQFLTRPISGICIAFSVLIVFTPQLKTLFKRVSRKKSIA
ncbi:MAG: tripartite tricarboxylate transporter permease [Acetivibrionales bacterium]|jgi:putative tricarboxylic transport membrane protein